MAKHKVQLEVALLLVKLIMNQKLWFSFIFRIAIFERKHTDLAENTLMSSIAFK